MKKLADGVFAVDLFVYIPKADALIAADLHLGYEEHLSRQGVLVPRFQFKDIIDRFESAISKTRPKIIILNGDVKHEFGKISNQEWRDVRRLMDFLRKKRLKVIAIKGNHDTIFGPLAKELNIEEVEELSLDGILIVHGDYVPEKLAPIMIIGHEHPAITLQEGSKVEKFKCFLVCKYRRSVVVCQPSLNPLTKGSDLSREKLLSPLLRNAREGDVFIVDEEQKEVLPFGKLSKISKGR